MDNVLTVINIIATVLSVIGAVLAIVYFKRTKHIQLLLQFKDSCDQLSTIIAQLTEHKRFLNPVANGKNPRALCEFYVEIEKGLREIVGNLDSQNQKKVMAILESDKINSFRYLSEIVSGKQIENGVLKNDNHEYDDLIGVISEARSYIKYQFERTGDKLK